MRSPKPNAGTQASKWLDQLPHDFLSHRGTWRQAFERLIELEPVSHLPDQDEKGFWKHELNAFDVAYRELDVCVDEVETDEVWGDRLPHDFLSHRETWRQGFERLIELEPESHLPDEDQRGFWQHELDAFDLAYRELDEILTKRSMGVLERTEMAAIKAIEQKPALVDIPAPDESAPEIETAVPHVSPW